MILRTRLGRSRASKGTFRHMSSYNRHPATSQPWVSAPTHTQNSWQLLARTQRPHVTLAVVWAVVTNFWRPEARRAVRNEARVCQADVRSQRHTGSKVSQSEFAQSRLSHPAPSRCRNLPALRCPCSSGTRSAVHMARIDPHKHTQSHTVTHSHTQSHTVTQASMRSESEVSTVAHQPGRRGVVPGT